jgi:hypothetical protein
MRHPTLLFIALILVACDKAPDTRGDAQPVSPAVVEFLLTSAATDFLAHRPQILPLS